MGEDEVEHKWMWHHRWKQERRYVVTIKKK